MMYIAILFVLLLVIIILFVAVLLKRKTYGTLSEKAVYSDTQTIPGKIMYSDTLQLKGKPDYIIKKGNEYIPIEVKNGKTPTAPYRNHIAQLFAYCVLIEAEYAVRPRYGIIKYPEKEFEIEYTDTGEMGIKKIIEEIISMKNSDTEPRCTHTEHNQGV